MAIFFTLSGFVIALSYGRWNWRDRPIFNLVRLFFYRFARLYPAFFLFAVLIVLRTPSLHDLTEPQVQSYLWPHLLLLHTWWPFKYDGLVAIEDHFNVAWSLSTECGLYLMFGLGTVIVALLPRWPLRSLFIGALFFAGTWELIGRAWTARAELVPAGWDDWDWGRWLFHFSPITVSLQFGIGVVAYKIGGLALSFRATKLASDAGALALLAIYALIGTRVLADHLDQALYSSLATGLLMIGATADSAVNRLLSGRAIVYLGTISYSVYLFHGFTPAIGFYAEVPTFTAGAAAYHAANAMVALALTIMLASGVYKFVEVPGRRAIRSLADRLLGLRQPSSRSEQAAPAE
jgi:peptidoglycan/LPS O-acetylase OafA/YrhL